MQSVKCLSEGNLSRVDRGRRSLSGTFRRRALPTSLARCQIKDEQVTGAEGKSWVSEYLPSTPRGSWAAALWFALISLVMSAVVLGTHDRIEREEAEARRDAVQQARALVTVYAAQLQYVSDQIDQLMRRVAFSWLDFPEVVDLERDQRRGLFPVHHSFFVFIVDAEGRIVRSTMQLDGPVSVANYPFFQSQRAGCCTGLTVHPVTYSPWVKRDVVRFVRRIDRDDGTFHGIVLVSVVPAFLATFQDESLRGRNDFVSVRLDSGALLATKVGQRNDAPRVFYKQDPQFTSVRGARLEPGEFFRDGRTRFVAWRKIPGFSVVALAGLTEEDALAAFRQVAQTYRVNAATVIALLAALVIGGIALFSKMAARRRMEEEVRRTYRVATDAANEGFYMLRPQFRQGQLVDLLVEDCNERAAELLETTSVRLIGAQISRTLPGEHCRELIALCAKAIEHSQVEDEFRVPAGWMRADWVFRRAVCFASGIALTLRDISDLKAHEQALADIANNDALTQLPNRRWLQGFLPTAIRRAARGSGRLALLFIDLDNFKTINDTLGHEAGDELLQQAAQRVRHAVRGSDHVARLGGDEFTVVLEQFDADDDIAHVARSIVDTLEKPFILTAGGSNLVSASIGISVYPRDGDAAELLLKHADVAMYAAKAAGKGRHHFYEPEMSEALLLRLSRERALRLAVERSEFVVHYQPRVTASSGQLSSFEALIRWRHPDRGVISPGEFIDLAEDTGLVVPIGDWVIREVIAQIARWKSDGERLVPVSVNVSPLQLRNGLLADVLLHALDEHRVEPGLLEVEVTESAVVDRSLTVVQQLDALRDGGIRLMIDDFGVGHSSLAQLHRLDVDVLKVDRGFTTALSEGSEGELLYRAIISMAEALEMTVVAEGVETLPQLRQLRAMGCDELQGYLISRPLPAEQVPGLLRQPVLPPFDRLDRMATA